MLRSDTARLIARAAAVARIGIGAMALVNPGPLCRMWVGPDGDQPASRMFGRIVGGRELALGLGTLLALEHGGPARGWLEACALADGIDFVVTASRFSRLPAIGRWVFLLGAAGASGAEAVAARTVDA